MSLCIHELTVSTCAVCSRKQVKPSYTRDDVILTIPARFTGRCSCGEATQEGEDIFLTNDGEWICRDCIDL